MNVTLAGSATISAGANSSGNLTILGTMADINATLASLTYTGNVDVSGTAADTLTVSTSDEGNTGAGGIMHDTDNVQINITAVNDDPVLAAIGDQSVNELATLNFTVSATDVDIPANALSYSLDATSIAAGMTINASTGEFSWTPAESQDGSHSVTITVTDDGVGTLSDSETFTITVNDINNTPTDLIFTSASYGGVNINSDGGNDVYFIADDGSSLLGGLTTVTIEASFSIDTPGADLSPLLSYAAGSNDEELALFLKWDGRIWFGANDNGSNLQSTTGNYTQLFDGEQHHVGVSWDASNGAVEFYIDGQQVESFTGYKTGQTVAGGGELVFGQDQDSLLGGFKTIDVFSGSLYDVRIFDGIRTAVEIESNYTQTLPNTESQMIANWTFSDLSPTGTITETVSGNNLTEQHVVGTGFSPSTPEITFRIPENSADGTVVGSVTAIDPDSGDTFTYSLFDNAGGRFDLDSGTGVITVADGSLSTTKPL